KAMPVSLCETCSWMREVRTATSRFLLCELSRTNSTFPKYPRQPVVRCDGYRQKQRQESSLMNDVVVRLEVSSDLEGVRQVHRLAFGGEDEARLVDALRDGGFVRVSLVAENDRMIVGHILFSDLPIVTEAGVLKALALAPLAVLPEHQRRGIGSTLILQGLEACREQGHRIVIVVGHPAFYPRFGFSADLASRLDSPFSGKPSFMA